MPLSPLEYLRHILDETKYLIDERQGLSKEQFLQDATQLQMLDDAHALEDLRVPPGNRLEALQGNFKGQWSIRINDQWRVCFRFDDGDAFDVAIIDYH